MKKIKNIPNISAIKNSICFEIEDRKDHFTHSFFKYPAKFPSEVANWSIRNFSKKNDLILDCFAGSGTSIVEALMLGRRPLAIDSDPLSKIIIKAKTYILNKREILIIRNNLNNLIKYNKIKFYPDLVNLKKWFPKINIQKLSDIKANIECFKISNKNVYNFLLVCFASIIRKCSFADNVSPKPYISSRIKKIPQDPIKLFLNVVERNLKVFEIKLRKINCKVKFIGNDARSNIHRNFSGKIAHVIASPPYINAFDYTRILRLENLWLDNFKSKNIIEIKKKQIGTEIVSASEYLQKPISLNIDSLDRIILKVYKSDKRRAHIVLKYFKDMKININVVYNSLKKDGIYTLVVGDCSIKGVYFDISKYLTILAQNNGFILIKKFSYIIKNPYLRIPRSGKGGKIKFDKIIVLKKC
jgi:hypothetical protein